jgi:hypothetical protein
VLQFLSVSSSDELRLRALLFLGWRMELREKSTEKRYGNSCNTKAMQKFLQVERKSIAGSMQQLSPSRHTENRIYSASQGQV